VKTVAFRVRSFLKGLFRSWLREGVRWYSTTEGLVRILLEGAAVVGLLGAGLDPLQVLLLWLVLHSVAWVFLYGGHAKIRTWAKTPTQVSHLETQLGEFLRWAPNQRTFSAVVLRGSGARGTMDEYSDIDLALIQGRSILRSVLAVWALRARSAFRRVPVEAHLLDDARLVPFLAKGRPWRIISRNPASASDPTGLRGRLIVFSGIDGSGKTTVATRLVERLRSRGVRAEYFYGHRTAYRKRGTHLSFAIAFRSFWRHSGRALPDLRSHRWARGVFALMTLLDYRLVMTRLAKALRPGVTVVTDRYVADVIAFLRFLGGGFEPIEGFLLRVSLDPDATVFFDLEPRVAFGRKSEQTLEELERFEAAYRDLRQIVLMRTVDASRPVDDVVDQVMRILDEGAEVPVRVAPAQTS